MVEILALVAVWIVAFSVGWTAREKYAMRHMARIIQKAETEAEHHFKKNFILIDIEQHDGKYFVYNHKDKTFMAQGTTRQALEEMLEDRFPGKKFAASEENLIEMGFANASDSK